MAPHHDFGSSTMDLRSPNRPVPLDFSAILDAVPAQIAVLDGEGVIVAVNRPWRQRAPAELSLGADFSSTWPRNYDTGPAGAAGLTSSVHEVLAGRRQEFVLECPCHSPDRDCAVRLTVRPYRDSGFAGAVVAQEILTPQPREGQEAEDRRQSEKMESMGRLLGGVAHDFANLLTLIAGYSDIVLNRMNPLEPLRLELEEIRKAANRGSRLTAQLLGFTRRQSVQPRVLDLNSVITDMEKMLRPIIGEHIELSIVSAPDLWQIRADAGQMEQVIMNLVLNARDAMPRGGKIEIRTANVTLDAQQALAHEIPPGRFAALTFRDTGEGMDAQTMSHLFQPFFTTKEKGKGTGLGLSTVYGIVRENHGDVWADSVPGKGTTFNICLPRVDSEGEPAEQPAAARAPREGNETILLVEDEDGVRRLLKHILSKQGYKVLEACDGPSALAILEQNHETIHLLLTDMVMPHMSGREVAERVLVLRPATRVIYMSGYTDDVLMRTGALGPGMTFLQKPLKPDVLAARVREVLDARASR
jgi:two-component system cell cycle sensor histidine kinase/response regulator CckA